MNDLPKPLGSIPEPDLFTVIAQAIEDAKYNFNCHQVGTIVSFDAGLQTAQIKLGVQRLVPVKSGDSSTYAVRDYPMLVDCPVFVPAGGDGRLTFPIAAGDGCLVLFNDRDLDLWFDSGTVAPPNSPRAHSLSDGLALVGFRNKATKIGDYSTTSAQLRFAGGSLKINDKIALDAAAVSLKTLLTDIIAALTALNAKTGPSASVQIAQVTTDVTHFCQ